MTRLSRKPLKLLLTFMGVDSIEANTREQKVTVIGEMDTVAMAKKLKKKLGKVDILTVGPAMEDKKKKDDKK
ncbi:Heavy metal-associated isoprenylated plant protein 39 [Linum perenne]